MSDPSAALRTLSDLPGPRGWPLAGNALQLDLERLHLQLEGWAKTYGESYVFKLGPQPVLVISGLESSLTVLKERPKSFRRFSRIESVLEEMGGNGVFSAEGEGWQRQRKLVTKAMSPKQIEDAYPALKAITARLMRRWERAAVSGRPCNMLDDLTRYTVDTTTSLLFGRDLNTLETEGVVIQEHIHRILPMVNARINAPFPYWRYVRLPKDRALDKALAATQEFLGEMIADARRTNAGKSPQDRRSLLEVMVELRDLPGSEFAEEDLRANLVTLLLTGEDTTSYTLAWAVHALAADPELQDSLHAGARSIMGMAPIPEAFQDIALFETLEGFLFEVMRKKPVAPIISMEAGEDAVLDGIAVPRGTPIMILARPAALDGRNFPRPGTIEPERWIGGKTNGGVRDSRAFLQFGAGPRLCPGRYFSLVEMKLVLAMLLARFKVTPSEPLDNSEEVFGFTMKPSRLMVNITAGP